MATARWLRGLTFLLIWTSPLWAQEPELVGPVAPAPALSSVMEELQRPFADWCIPAIRRAVEPQPQLEKQTQASGIFDETLEQTADQLFQEAVRTEAEGQSWLAVEKLLTVLEQCPSFSRCDEVEAHLRAIAGRWLDDARREKPRQAKPCFALPSAIVEERRPSEKGGEADGYRVLSAIERLGRRKVTDPETFLWDHAAHEFPEGTEWIEDCLLEIPSRPPGVSEVGAFVSGGCEFDHTPRIPSRRWFSPKWRRQITMALQFEAPPPDNWGGFQLIFLIDP